MQERKIFIFSNRKDVSFCFAAGYILKNTITFICNVLKDLRMYNYTTKLLHSYHIEILYQIQFLGLIRIDILKPKHCRT